MSVAMEFMVYASNIFVFLPDFSGGVITGKAAQ